MLHYSISVSAGVSPRDRPLQYVVPCFSTSSNSIVLYTIPVLLSPNVVEVKSAFIAIIIIFASTLGLFVIHNFYLLYSLST
jgi:hypothetical protein